MLELIFLVVELGQGQCSHQMDPVIEIELDQASRILQDSKKEVIRYVADHYTEIEDKMKGHSEGTSGF